MYTPYFGSLILPLVVDGLWLRFNNSLIKFGLSKPEFQYFYKAICCNRPSFSTKKVSWPYIRERRSALDLSLLLSEVLGTTLVLVKSLLWPHCPYFRVWGVWKWSLYLFFLKFFFAVNVGQGFLPNSEKPIPEFRIS